MLTGQIDMGFATDFAGLTRFSTNQLRLVGVVARPQPGFYQLAARTGISKPSDLVGKKMGVVLGTNQQYLTVRYLRLNHIDPRTVTFVPIPDLLTFVTALQSGKIDAGWVWGAGITTVQSMSNAKLIASDAAGKLNETIWLVATKSFVAHDPGVVENVLKSFKQSISWTNQNTPAAAKIVASFDHAPVSQLTTQLPQSGWVLALQQHDLASIDNIVEFCRAAGILKGTVNLKAWIDPDLLRRADPSAVNLTW
jgi:NitT/TauT family transport system substrate-binding protein